MAVDLHTHSTFSDGTLTPVELLTKAESINLTAIALTDHDEVNGSKELLKDVDNVNVEIVCGVEFSIDIALEGNAHLHLLGLFLDLDCEELNFTLTHLRTGRKKRAVKIIKQLQDSGLSVEVSDLDLVYGPGSIGRPHIAKILVKKNIVNSAWEAFNKLLAKGKPGYVPKEKLPLKRAIELIHKARGLAILAHPVSLKFKQYTDTESFLKELSSIGLDGIEVYHPSHSNNFSHYLLNAAERNNLLISGGSDFHGEAKPGIMLGFGKGDFNVPDSVYFNLKNALKA